MPAGGAAGDFQADLCHTHSVVRWNPDQLVVLQFRAGRRGIQLHFRPRVQLVNLQRHCVADDGGFFALDRRVKICLIRQAECRLRNLHKLGVITDKEIVILVVEKHDRDDRVGAIRAYEISRCALRAIVAVNLLKPLLNSTLPTSLKLFNETATSVSFRNPK